MVKKKSTIIMIVSLALLIIAFSIIVFMPKGDAKKDVPEEATTSIFDVSLINPKSGFITDPLVVDSIKTSLGPYSDLDVETLIFKTVDDDNLYAVAQYNSNTIIGIHFCISTGETVCDIEVSEQSMMPKPIEE